ncbi:MAG: type III secretion system inner membrane ring subunit SctD [Geminicoccaceae bacterium]
MDQHRAESTDIPEAFVFKVLSGPQLGAEAEYGGGICRIGSNSENDIVLADAAVKQRHVALDLADGGFRFMEMDGTIETDAGLVEDDRLLPFFTVFRLGSTSMAVGPRSIEWPALGPLADLPIPSPATAEPDLPKEEQDDGSPVRNPDAKSARPRLFILGAIVAILATVALFENRRPSDDRLPPLVSEQQPNDAELILDLLAPFEAEANLQLLADDNHLVVEGYVGTESIMQEIESLITATTPKAQSRLFAGDQLVDAARETLKALGSKLAVDYVPHGNLRLSGLVSMNSDLQRIVDMLKSDVAGLKNVENAVLTNVDAVDHLRDRLVDIGLAEKVGLRMQEDSIIAYGEIDPRDLEAWRSIRQEFDQDYMPHLDLISRVVLQDASAAQSGSPGQTGATSTSAEFAIIGINAGDPPFFVANDSARYLEGSKIFGDWTVERIEIDRVVLSRNGQQRILRL